LMLFFQYESSPPAPPPALTLSVNVEENDLDEVESPSHTSRQNNTSLSQFTEF
jgi:hypothetical protein